MSGTTEESLIARAFAAGASSVAIRSRAPHFDDFEAEIDAHTVTRDEHGRSLSQLASAKALGATPIEALEAALAKVASPAAIEARAAEPRYAVEGRPGVFVTRRELAAAADDVELAKLAAADHEPDEATA